MYFLQIQQSSEIIARHKVHDFIPSVPELHGTVVAGRVEGGGVHLLASVAQHLSKPSSFPKVDRVAHGVATKSVHVDGELLVLLNLHSRVGGSWWVGLVLLVQVEAHLLVHHPIVQHLHPGEDGHSHLHLLLLLVHARNVPEQFHEHLILGLVLPSLSAHHLLHHLDQVEVVGVPGLGVLLLHLVRRLRARPLHTWVLPHLISIKLFERGVRNLLIVTVDLASLIIPRESAEDVFQPLKLGRGGGGGENE